MELVMEDIGVKKKEWLKKRLSPESRFNDEWWEEDV